MRTCGVELNRDKMNAKSGAPFPCPQEEQKQLRVRTAWRARRWWALTLAVRSPQRQIALQVVWGVLGRLLHGSQPRRACAISKCVCFDWQGFFNLNFFQNVQPKHKWEPPEPSSYALSLMAYSCKTCTYSPFWVRKVAYNKVWISKFSNLLGKHTRAWAPFGLAA